MRAALAQSRNIPAVKALYLAGIEQSIDAATALGIKGLSVTIPLKEKIVPFIDEIEASSQPIGAINTLLFKEEKIENFVKIINFY